MTGGTMQNETLHLEEAFTTDSAPSSREDCDIRRDARKDLHSSGSTETLCPETVDGLLVLEDDSCQQQLTSQLPVALVTPIINASLKSDSIHRPVSHSRIRQQNVAFADNRSETSSEQTKASKFKVVKLESKAPYFRGRWQCFDFHDRMKDSCKPVTQDKVSSSTEQQSSTASTTTTLVAAGVTVNSPANNAPAELIPDLPASLPLLVPAAVIPSKFKVTAVQLPPNTSAVTATPLLLVDSLAKTLPDNKPQPALAQTTVNLPTAVIRVSQDSTDSSSLSSVSQQSTAQPGQRPLQHPQFPILISDSNAALSAELSRRTTVDITAAGSQEIAGLCLDNKIRQCMDLVGNHLIIAVREELGQVTGELTRLKEKLEQLEFENNALRSENIILRAAAGADSQNRSQPSTKRK